MKSGMLGEKYYTEDTLELSNLYNYYHYIYLVSLLNGHVIHIRHSRKSTKCSIVFLSIKSSFKTQFGGQR